MAGMAVSVPRGDAGEWQPAHMAAATRMSVAAGSPARLSPSRPCPARGPAKLFPAIPISKASVARGR